MKKKTEKFSDGVSGHNYKPWEGQKLDYGLTSASVYRRVIIHTLGV
jgi:hypothetical protein